jgi:ATP-dependent Clp protease ATP-binding subunit ClpA
MANPKIAGTRREVTSDLAAALGKILIDQPQAIERIVPYVNIHRANLAPEGRPVGTFLLLGPTGTGKTRTVEALAEVIHGSRKNILRIDCGEYQMEHEITKLIGAPPGYLGHRETAPVLTQAKVNAAASENSTLSILLFDEIEKASPSMQRILLGILDRAQLKLGDGGVVHFEESIIFFTSNLGARQVQQALAPNYGLSKSIEHKKPAHSKLEKIAVDAAKKHFSAEFINRLDEKIMYRSLDTSATNRILNIILEEQSQLIGCRLGPLKSFRLGITKRGTKLLVKLGTSEEYGARELKRVCQRHFFQPVAQLYGGMRIPPGSLIILDAWAGSFRIRMAGDPVPMYQERGGM